MSFRFHFIEGQNFLDINAGFSKISVPDVDVAVAEYREGVFKYTRKYPGIPKIGDIELTKGVIKKASDFFVWVLKCIDGGETYRSDVTIVEYHIGDELGINGAPSRLIRLKEAFAMNFKPTNDHDASSSEVSVQSMKLVCEEFDIEVIEAQ